MNDAAERALPDAAARADKHALQELMRRSDGPGLRQAGLHFGLILCTGTLVVLAGESLWVWPAMLLHGIGLVFLFAAEHETAHRTAFKSRWLNEAVIWIAGLVVLQRQLRKEFPDRSTIEVWATLKGGPAARPTAPVATEPLPAD